MTNFIEVDLLHSGLGPSTLMKKMSHRIFIRCRIQTATTTVEGCVKVPQLPENLPTTKSTYPPLRHIFRRTLHLVYLLTHVHCCSVHNSHKLETT